MRTYVKKGPNPVVSIPANDDWLSCDGHRTKIVWFREFGLVTDRDPNFLPNLFELFLKNFFVAVDSAISPLDPVGVGVRVSPGCFVWSWRYLVWSWGTVQVAARIFSLELGFLENGCTSL